MPVIALVRPEASLVAEPVGVLASPAVGEAEGRLLLYGRAMRLCFVVVLAVWIGVQIGCLLSLFLNFRYGIVTGTIDGTIAFKFWSPIEYFSPNHAMLNAFAPHAFPLTVAIGYTIILAIGSAPFCAALFYLAQLFSLYAQGQIFAQRNATAMRRIGHSIMATGYSPLLLGPAAHVIGVLKPVTGINSAMIACVLLGLVLLGISHVMQIGQRMQQEQESFI